MTQFASPADAPSDFRALYRQAFAAFGAAALWNKAQLESPTPEHALVIARALRIEGDRQARQLAERIEQAVESERRAAP